MTMQVRAHSTSTGAVIGPEADVVGLGGIFSHLMNEHGELIRLMSLLFAARGSEERSYLYPALRTDLLTHERTERAVVYATLGQLSATQAMAEAHEQQVGALETLIHRLDSLNIHSNEWLRTMLQLPNLVRYHVRQEEDEFFPLARAAVGAQTSHELRAAYLHAKLGIRNSVESEFRPTT